VGSWAETIAQGVLVLHLTQSPLALGVAAALRYLPVLLLGPVGGLIVDRHDRRRTLIVTQTLLGAVSATFGVVVLLSVAQLWQVFLVATVFGVVTAVDNPARMALIPEIVRPDALRSAITLNSVLANVGRGVGPLLAAALISSVGIGWCFIVNAGSFVVVIVALLAMRASGIVSEGTIHKGAGQLREAWQIARSTPQILAPLMMMALVGTLTFEFEVSLPVFGESVLHGGPGEYAALTAGFGLGAVAAGLLLLVFPPKGAGRMAVISAVYGVALLCTALAPSPMVANLLIIAVGSFSIAFLVTGNSTVQLHAPAGMRGRITSLWTTAFVGSTPIGALIVGAVATSLGGRAALLVGASACAAAAMLGMLILRQGRRIHT
jgi:MFS family permease